MKITPSGSKAGGSSQARVLGTEIFLSRQQTELGGLFTLEKEVAGTVSPPSLPISPAGDRCLHLGFVLGAR